MPGWLVLVPLRHSTTIAELSDAEALGLGAWQVRLSRALYAVTGCAKTYVAQFAEGEGFGHVHIVPRMAVLPASQLGPNVFQLVGRDEADSVSADHMDEIARRIQTQRDAGTDLHHLGQFDPR